ncbi:MAG TPA: amino acid permease [Steroidobacteraceae bacterium]|jgi:APA family basic amino acid/polyamine antiporter|nr:amino acid permease [Steroidobacteraceae bacterium]
MDWRIKSLDEILATAERRSLPRSLGAARLLMLGVGAVIGTGIFVLTAAAAQKAGPGMMLSFVISGAVCAVTALCYAEFSSMAPVAGSAYTYAYAVYGEIVAWLVGWALILEYAVASSAVSVGWSNYFVGGAARLFHITIPVALTKGYFAASGGAVNLPAMFVAISCTMLLVIGTRESATFNAILVTIKLLALAMFVVLAVPAAKSQNFQPLAPLGMSGVSAAAASIFFAYAGFDAVSTAAEETRNPQRNVPIALIGSLVICTVFYLLVAAGEIGAVGAQPVFGTGGEALTPGTRTFAATCLASANQAKLVCSDEALAFVLNRIGHGVAANVIGLAAFLSLPTVILVMLYGQTRLFFSMSRDGLLPPLLCRIHTRYKTPHVVTMITGCFVALAAGLFPVGALADVANSGTLFAFITVSMGMMILRLRDPTRIRSFRVPAITIIGPLSVLGCAYLFWHLPLFTRTVFLAWTGAGLVIYMSYSYRRSAMTAERK